LKIKKYKNLKKKELNRWLKFNVKKDSRNKLKNKESK